jgi:hypothetical protein
MDDARANDTERQYVNALRGFYGHLTMYIVVGIFLAAIDWLTPGAPWFYWPLFGWGIGVVMHGVGLLISNRFFGPDWEARKLASLEQRRRHT